MDNHVYISVTTDSSDIKEGSVWFICLKSEEKVLYVEVPHNNTKCDADTFNYLFKQSYFQGMAEADANLKVLKKDDGNDFVPVNAFISQDKAKQIDKIQKFIEEVYEKSNKRVVMVFENSYDYIYFISEAFEHKNGYAIIPDFIETGSIIIETFYTLVGDWDRYLKTKSEFLDMFIQNTKDDKESQAYIIIERMSILLDTLVLEDSTQIILNSFIQEE